MKGTHGVEKYFRLPYKCVVSSSMFPKVVNGGQFRDILTTVDNERNKSNGAKTHPIGEFIPCDSVRLNKKECKLNHASSFSNKKGLDSGDRRLMITNELFVIVNASNIPAETKSSK
mmetsp:Transcript_27934/g.58526  ORF Transcript_27934/g.58526 Transcript_27934/m.58526 type:complete len:116 (+) Transcript_27934:450-797(+)